MNPCVANCYTVHWSWNYKGNEIVDDEMVVPCSTYGGEDRRVQGYVRETGKGDR